LSDDVYTITSTKVPEELQGRGYGKVMMEVLLSELEKRDAKVVPVCSYVVHYLNRNLQWAHLKVDA
jgi:predicted GNAT family acetyltransferase